MELSDRDYVEKLIDALLMDQQVQNVRSRLNELRPYVHSVDDATFGYLLGEITVSCLDQWLINHHRKATVEEMTEMQRIVLEKIPRIKSQIAKTFI